MPTSNDSTSSSSAIETQFVAGLVPPSKSAQNRMRPWIEGARKPVPARP